MKRPLIIIFIVCLFRLSFVSSVSAVTCDSTKRGICGPSGGCNYGEQCWYDLQRNSVCVVNPDCPQKPIICDSVSSVSECKTIIGESFSSSSLGLPVGTTCPSGGTCQQQGAPYADSDKCNCVTTPISTPSPSVTPSISPSPTTTSTPSSPQPTINFLAFPTLTIPDTIPACVVADSRDETIYPPNSACYAEVKRTQSKLKDYTKTCIKEPIVTYEDTRLPSETTSGEGDNSYQNCFGKNGRPCNVYITVTTDISKAELGSYGPNNDTLLTSSSSADTIAKKYLFNSLFDRPYFILDNTPREAWRTYWRLMPFYEQANLTAQFINLVLMSDSLDNDTLKRINNTKYQYVNSKGEKKETTVKKLAGSLPDCLKSEPVCKDFAQVYNKLKPETREAYDTLIPLSFNNLRGFIALSPPSFPDRNPMPRTVSRESIPYIETIFSGLLSSKYGLIANLQPDWLFTKSTENLTDTNTGYDLTTGKDNYYLGQWMPNLGRFGDYEMDSNVSDHADVDSCPDIPDVYNVSAPRTFPKNSSNQDPNHIQEIQILGSSLEWKEVNENASPVYISGTTTVDHYKCPSGVWQLIGKRCVQYKVTGTGKGIALTVFNNPKTTDLKQSIVGNQESSLYNTLIPMNLLTPTPTDKKIDAPVANHAAINTDYSGLGSVGNTENPIIRENNLAQDIVHIIQNCWLVPKDQQSSSKCGSTTCGSEPIPSLDVSNSVCKVKNNSLKLPEILIKGIEKAADTFNVPPSLLIGVMYGEGAFNPGSNYFNSTFVEENFKACAKLPNCNESAPVIDNIVPFFQQYWGDLADAVTVLDSKRKPNACNLLDGIFALAKDLSQNQYGSAAFAGKTCFGIPLNSGSGGSSSCSWSNSGVETAIRVWEFGVNYNSTYGCATKLNSCLLGGGEAANCASGNDTCETINNRYSQVSHNGCVWDIYTKNK